MAETLGAHKPAEPAHYDQILSFDEERLVNEAYARLEVWEQGCRERHDMAREARRILALDDPKQDPEGTPELRKTLQLQTLKSTFNNSVADQMDNMPEARLLPEREELREVSEDMNDVMRFIFEQNNYESMHRRRVEDMFCTGTAITQIAWDEEMHNGKGNVALIRWPIEAFLWDPAAEDIQEARALIKVAWHPLSWYAARYPEQAKHIAAEDSAYSDVGLPDSWHARLANDEPRAMLMEYWYRLYDAAKKRWTVNVAIMAGRALLEHQEDVYAHGMYPFVLDVFDPVEGLPVGDGMVMELAPMMRYVNRYAHYIDENLRMSSKGRLLAREGAEIDMEALADWTRDIIMGQRVSEEDVRWLQSKPLPQMAPQQMMQFQADIKQDSGQNQFTRGETAGGVTAASAISALQEAGGKITRLRTNVLQQGFKKIAEQVLWLVAQFYDGDRTQLVTGKDGKPRQIDMDAARLMGSKRKKGGALPPPPYAVQVQVQRRNPLRVQAQNDLFIQAYTMAAQAEQAFPLTLLFELLNVDGKERIMPILQAADAQAQQMQALMAENEQLRANEAGLKQALMQVSSQGVEAPAGEGLEAMQGMPAAAGDTSEQFSI